MRQQRLWHIGLINACNEADRMSAATEALEFIDSCKHMECLGGMRLQFSD